MGKTLMLEIGLVVGLVVCLGAFVESYIPLGRHSLTPPFDTFKEHSGERHLQNWDYGGHTLVKENFIRLTQDRQSRRGWMFNTERLEQKEFGMQLRFRISGSGKHLYGDGLAIWLTKKNRNPAFEEGMILGHTDQFVGFGIMFDTFRNVEHGHVHKDISLLVSDGKEPVSLDTERPGCESHYRYYEGREDFSVDNESRARIWLEKGTLSLEVDKYGKDDWKQCFKVNLDKDYNLPSDWQDNYYLAVSASTGALADNHDILELKIAEPDRFSHILKMDDEEKDMPSVQIDTHPKIKADEVAEHVNDLAYEVTDIDKAVKKLQHKQEHDLEQVRMSLEKMIKKLEEREDGSADRLSQLEKDRALDQKISDRLATLEEMLNSKVEQRLNKLESKLGVKIETAASSSGGWKIPLFVVVVLVGAYMAYTARSLNKLHRRDKLI